LSRSVARDERDCGFGNAKPLGQHGNQRLVGFAFFGHVADAHFQMGFAVTIQLHAIDTITPAIRGKPNGEANVIIKRLEGCNHSRTGASVLHSS
jgi:hypothetical protein